MKNISIAVVDYDCGNIHSATKAIELAMSGSSAKGSVSLTKDPEEIIKSDKIVLPGVGAFEACINKLKGIDGLKEALDEVLQGAKGFSQSVAKLHEFGDIFFSNEFLEPRPLLRAIREENGCVLLIDEIDKADHEFESLLLEILSDYQISIPEIGTVKATTEPPIVFLTSNNTREISDALKRRCLHLYIPFPDTDLESRIIEARVPEIPPELKRQLVQFIQELRQLDLKKLPAISETIDWARTLVLLHAESLEPKMVKDTLNVILKFQEDIENVNGEVNALTAKIAK